MFERILVPLDGSTLAEQALVPALQVAKSVSGEILLMRVPMYTGSVDNPVSPAHQYSWPQETHIPIKGEAAEYLRDVLLKNAAPGVNIRTIVVQGDRASAIVDTAIAEQVDLIVMSTHGRTGLSRWVLGSVTSRVLRQAPCPVLVMRKAIPVKHILITLDGSLLAEQAFMPGLALAHACVANVTLLRVITGPDDLIESYTIPENIALPGTQPGRREIEAAENYLRDFIAIHDTGSINIELAAVSGTASETIVDFATTNNVDIIAMTTHGRTGLRRWIYGSVTEKVLYGTDSGVLIIRPPEY